MKKCPFNNEICGDSCALYIAPNELNELVYNKLVSIGVYSSGTGVCSLKTSALSLNRHIFENTITKRSI